MSKVIQAFVMAAGRGERMRPLTDNIPKPLVKIAGKMMLDRVIEKIDNIPGGGISKIVINGYYLADILEKHVRSLNNPKIIFSRESEKLETGGGLLQALPFFDETKPILIINSDIIWQDNNEVLKFLIENFDENKMDVLLGLKPKNEFPGYEGPGDFDFDKTTGQLIKPINKTELEYVYVGVQIFHPRIMTNCPPPPLSLSHFYKKARKENGVLEKIYGVELPGKFFHVGTVEAIAKTEKMMTI